MIGLAQKNQTTTMWVKKDEIKSILQLIKIKLPTNNTNELK